MTSPTTFKPSVYYTIHPSLKGFLLTAVICIGALGLIFAITEHQTQLVPIREFLTFHSEGSDSWTPMIAGVDYLQSHQPDLLYDRVFFHDQTKFQYPPTSLLFIQVLTPLQSLLDQLKLSLIDLLNYVNWVGVALIIGVSVYLFFLSQKQYLPQADGPVRIWRRLFDFGLLIVVCLLFYPMMRGYDLGQVQIWIDALFAIACVAWLKDNKKMAGACVALLCLFKPQYGLIVLWGLIRRQWNFVVSAVVVLAIGLSISLAVYGLNNHLDYLKVLSYISQHGEAFYPNNSVNGLLNRLLFNGSNLTWMPNDFAPYNAVVYYGTVISSLAIIGAALYIPRRSGGTIFDFFIIALSSTIASPVAWEHHYGILLPIFMVLIPFLIARMPLGKYTVVFLGVSYVLCSSFLPIFNTLADTPLNILQSYLFFGALMLLVMIYIVNAKQEVRDGSVGALPAARTLITDAPDAAL